MVAERQAEWENGSDCHTEAVLLKGKEERERMSKAEETRVCVGTDLHKQQMTVCAEDEETGEVLLREQYRTDAEGYEAFCEGLHRIEEETGKPIAIAVEATGNARFFKNRMEKEGFEVLVVNTNKCVLNVRKYGRKLHVISVIDNLVKGASGQATQNLNLLFGLPEDTGLHLKATRF